MPASHHSVFYRPDALPATRQTTLKHWRHVDVICRCVRQSAGCLVLALGLASMVGSAYYPSADLHPHILHTANNYITSSAMAHLILAYLISSELSGFVHQKCGYSSQRLILPHSLDYGTEVNLSAKWGNAVLSLLLSFPSLSFPPFSTLSFSMPTFHSPFLPSHPFLNPIIGSMGVL